MNRPIRPPIAPARLGVICLLTWLLGAGVALAEPPEQPQQPDPTVQSPKAAEDPPADPTADPTGESAPTTTPEPAALVSETSAGAPPQHDVPADGEAPEIEDTAVVPEPAQPPSEAPQKPASTPAETAQAIPEDLLGAEPAQTIPERRPPPADLPDSVDDEEKVRRYYQALYRPEDNPGLLRVSVHGLFLAAGGKNLGGRLGGVQAEVGQSWNRVGYGIGVAAYGGDTLIGSQQYSQSYGMFGGGPTISLGRTGLLQHGYLDVTAGYDFFYMPATDSRFAVRDGAQGESFFVPHGPRVRLDLGLIGLGKRQRKLRHGMGISLGWQGLLSSLAGGRHSYGNVLMVGLSYMAQ